MKKIIITAFLLITQSLVALAHPGIGIVSDSHGNIYYTDLKQVWKISPGGKKTVVVRSVHTHELYIDANDDLYGEHLWYNGEKSDTWGYYIWCLRQDGSLANVQGPSAGFRTDYSFVRDSSGNMYWVERFIVSRFKKKTPGGIITTIGEGKFRDIRWIYCTPDGILYFIDLDRLYKLDRDGKFTLVSDELDDAPSLPELLGDKRHRVYGIWTDTSSNIYIALRAAKKVKRISPGGGIKTVVYTAEPWSPDAGVFDKNGNLWLLESSVTNECRVRKFTKEELDKPARGRSNAITMNYFAPAGILIAILGLVILSIKRLMKRLFTLTGYKNQL